VKVVHIFKDFYPPTTGGIEQHMHLLCSELSKHVDVAVLVPSRSCRMVDEQIDGIRVVRVPEFGRYASAPLCPTLPRWLRRLRPDIVHLHFPNPMGDLGYLMSGVRAPLVVTYHADIIKQRRFLPFYRPIVDAVLRRADRIIATSPDYIASSPVLSRYRDRCVVVPFGVDRRRFALRPTDGASVREARLRYGDRILLFVGVLRYYKGIDILLRSMQRVQGHAVIVGRGAEEAPLRARAAALNVADRVTFVGEVPDAELRVLLHACDVFVLPSIDRCEAFGIAQIEAMACGKPVVSSDLPTGVRFVNQNERTGLLVAPGDADALAGALSRLLEDPDARRRFGEAARNRVCREFTAERMTEATLEVYDRIAAASAPRRRDTASREVAERPFERLTQSDGAT
jgi:rhamnosyl/mannosyltransferase